MLEKNEHLPSHFYGARGHGARGHVYTTPARRAILNDTFEQRFGTGEAALSLYRLAAGALLKAGELTLIAPPESTSQTKPVL
jgi:hypothetical protein